MCTIKKYKECILLICSTLNRCQYTKLMLLGKLYSLQNVLSSYNHWSNVYHFYDCGNCKTQELAYKSYMEFTYKC